MSGYDVSYIFKDINGTQMSKTDANVAPGSANAIESGTVEITNKLIEYELPETGGSGNRWIVYVKWSCAYSNSCNNTFL